MKSAIRVILLSLIITSLAACTSFDQKAVKRPIKPGSSIGILVQPDHPDTTFMVMRKFINAGYTVKALRTIEAESLYPGLRELYTRGVKVDGSIERLHDMATMSDIRREVTLKNELSDVRRELGIDYLFTIHDDGNMFHAMGIELATYEVIYSHSVARRYPLGIGFMYDSFYGPNAELDHAMELFISGVQNREPVVARQAAPASTEQNAPKREMRLQ